MVHGGEVDRLVELIAQLDEEGLGLDPDIKRRLERGGRPQG